MRKDPRNIDNEINKEYCNLINAILNNLGNLRSLERILKK